MGNSIEALLHSCRVELVHSAFLPGRTSAQNVSLVTPFKSTWLMDLSLSMLFGGGRDGRKRCFSLVWKTFSTSASGEVEMIDHLWTEYFKNPSQWWDTRANKRNPKFPDFKHKVTRKSLWVDGWSTPPWAKAMLMLSKNNNGKGNSQPISTRRGRQIIQDCNGSTRSEAIAIMNNCVQQGIVTNSSYMFVEALQQCFKQNDVRAVKQVHACIVKSGMEQNVYVANNLVRVYIKFGRLQDARQVFDKIVKKSVFSWTIMIGGYAQHDCVEDVMEVFNQMCQEGAQPNEVTYLSILKACASPTTLKWGKEVHAYIRHGGFESDMRVATMLMRMYVKAGSIDDARQVFDRMVVHDVVTWTVIIGGLAEHGRGHEAYELFLQMQRRGFVPNECTYVSILNPCASEGALEWVKEVERHTLKMGFESNLRVGNAFIHMYAKVGSIDDARLVFDRMVVHDVVTWTVTIGGLAMHGCGHEAYELFLQMQRRGFVPDQCTYVSILNPCASEGALEWVKEVERHALKVGFELTLRVGNALIHMYAKVGSIDDARQVFDKMVDHDVVTWTVIIDGLAKHGRGHEAVELFGKMIAEGTMPDELLFVAVLLACSHAGLVDQGRRLFLAMTKDFGIEPTQKHYTCMVDLLGRVGHLEEALRFIQDMPFEPDGASWGALLGACRIYGNVELAELVAEKLFILEPKNASPYVLLSNVYAAASKLDKVALVCKVMQARGICKEPGCSWVEVGNKVHYFVVGDTSHLEAKDIYAELKRLSKRIKARGYIPDTELVLHDINEFEKEFVLCSHSEKLAIAYGLMHLPCEKPIHVRKNLRVCKDCHTTTKFISKVTAREIVVRDAIRFHHFKDGMCSCGDYW